MTTYVVAPDSFKGSLSAVQFCEIAKSVIAQCDPGSTVITLPLSDGGEGFVESFLFAGLAEKESLWVSDPIGRKTKATFAWQAQTETAIIEMAQASGLPKLQPDERNPLQAHTYGTGQLVDAALNLGAKKIILGLGGSATNDGGMGALQALGVSFFDDSGKEIGLGGQALKKIVSIGEIPQRLLDVEWLIASDVTNPLLGKTGATSVFGPQKGVSDLNFNALESGLENWAQRIEEKTGRQVKDLPGAGAAGGMAAGFIGLLGAHIEPGFEVLNSALGLEKTFAAQPIDWLITGEGRLDEQTRFGKLPMQMAQLGAKYSIPTVAVCGSLGTHPSELPEFKAVFSILSRPMEEFEAFRFAPMLLKQTLFSIVALLKK
ncbi:MULTISPECIES: glycerate kinase [Thiomicrorhabdus]|uniref:Glycerate kinase n=1 Tax=Thiomicrorhabdus heinhorstiae TaxID=2748010 RepID=A0ABS0BWV2_9GAMM|nr:MULTISPECIES: glycerate kinase [Thiomicrorhabdus]MBF6057563.1 glycerate kinase [Thiomicrorhabdus heinhorstiae]